MWLRNRLRHLRRITRWGWFVIYQLGWAIFINIGALIGEWGSQKTKSLWERWTHPAWGWQVWLIGAFIIAILCIIEGSYRASREVEKERDEAVKERDKARNDQAPKMSLEYFVVGSLYFLQDSGLFIRNGGKTDAFKVRLDCDCWDKDKLVRLRFEGMPIQRVASDKSESIQVRTDYWADDRWCPIQGMPSVQIEDFFETLNRNNDESSSVPVSISYVDCEGREHTARWAIRSEGVFLKVKRIWCEPILGR